MQGRVKWAIAGRNQAKLESVRKHVAELNPACKVCYCSCPQHCHVTLVTRAQPRTLSCQLGVLIDCAI